MLKCLIDLAESTPKYLRHQLDIVFNLCLKVCMYSLCMISMVTTQLENLETSGNSKVVREKSGLLLNLLHHAANIPMTRISYQLSQFDKRKYLV